MWLIFAIGSAVFAALTSILAFVFLHETFTTKSLVGMILLTAGTIVMVM